MPGMRLLSGLRAAALATILAVSPTGVGAESTVGALPLFLDGTVAGAEAEALLSEAVATGRRLQVPVESDSPFCNRFCFKKCAESFKQVKKVQPQCKDDICDCACVCVDPPMPPTDPKKPDDAPVRVLDPAVRWRTFLFLGGNLMWLLFQMMVALFVWRELQQGQAGHGSTYLLASPGSSTSVLLLQSLCCPMVMSAHSLHITGVRNFWSVLVVYALVFWVPGPLGLLLFGLVHLCYRRMLRQRLGLSSGSFLDGLRAVLFFWCAILQEARLVNSMLARGFSDKVELLDMKDKANYDGAGGGAGSGAGGDGLA